jgi:hypothetical protein
LGRDWQDGSGWTYTLNHLWNVLSSYPEVSETQLESPVELAPLVLIFAVYIFMSDYRLSRIQRSIDALTRKLPTPVE